MTTVTNLTAAALAAVLALGLTACGSDDEPAPATAETSAPADATPSPDRDDDRDDDDRAIDAETRDRLERIALDEVGEGRVEDVERSDDRDHAYEVDVELPGDDDVTVEISEDFEVVRVDR